MEADPDGVDVPAAGAGGGRRARLAYLLTRTAVVAAVVVGWYLTRPLWHGLVYSMLFSLSGAVFIGGSLLAALLLWYLPSSRLPSGRSTQSSASSSSGTGPPNSLPELLVLIAGSSGRKLQVFGWIVGALFVLSIAVGLPAGAVEQRTLADRTMSDATEVAEFPQANPENPRVIPRRVSDVSTRGSVSYRQQRLGTSDIARQEDGSLAWSYPIQPDGFRNQLIERQRGVLVADMTQLGEQPTRAIEEEFTHGQGMFLHRSADWHLKLTDYLTRYDDDAVEFSADGRPYMYYPKTGHEWRLAPIPHTVPVWDGGALVSPDGTIEHLSPSEAQANPVLDGQRLYPLTLSRAEMESLRYRNGIVNQLPVVGAHEEEVEVAGLPDQVTNEQPFVIDLAEERMAYVTAMEPYGEDTRGLDEVWFADAESGEYTYFATGRETLTGPERAMGIARSADSQTNWGTNFVVVEPVPVTIQGELWWQMKVAPTDFTDVSRNVFVNADTGETVELDRDDAIRAFIAGNETGAVTDRDGAGTDGGDGGTGAVYFVVITDSNGTVVERIPVQRGQDTRIVSANRSRSGA